MENNVVVCIKPSEKRNSDRDMVDIYDDILDLRVPSGCRGLLAIYERNHR